MEIILYQINQDRDDNGCAFLGLDRLEGIFGDSQIDSEIYDQVFSGLVEADSLEEVFCIFNLAHPDGFAGRSMSVSDVVEIVESDSVVPGFYFCDSIGFRKVEFDTRNVAVKEDTIAVVLLEPGKLAVATRIDASLGGLQRTVGGWIEAVYPFEESVCIVCNEEGKLLGMPLNRALRYENKVTDIIAGPCFVCSCETASFGSLTEAQQQKYLQMFRYPEHFLNLGGEIISVPYKPNVDKGAR